MTYKERLTEILFTCKKCNKEVTCNDQKGMPRITDCKLCPHCGYKEFMRNNRK